MDFISGIMGNASEIDAQQLKQEFEKVLIGQEQIEAAYKLTRDLIVFTDKRLILVDKQGLTGNKVEYLSIPYKSITRFSVETAGQFDRDSELRIWISSHREPIQKEFNKGTDIVGVQKMLAQHVLR